MDAEIRVCVVTIFALLCCAQGEAAALEGVLQGVVSELTNIASMARDQVTNTRSAIRTTVTDIADKTVDPLFKAITSGIKRTATGSERNEEHRMSVEEFYRGLEIGEDVFCMAKKRRGSWEVTEVEECISEGRRVFMESLDKCLKKTRTSRNVGTEREDPAVGRESKRDDRVLGEAVSGTKNYLEVLLVIEMANGNGKDEDESDVQESGGELDNQDVRNTKCDLEKDDEEEETVTDEKEMKLEVLFETSDGGQMNDTLIKGDKFLPVLTGAPEGSERTKRSGRGSRRHRRRG